MNSAIPGTDANVRWEIVPPLAKSGSERESAFAGKME
jgi:hypothetical protein